MSQINDALKKAKQAQANAPVRESAPQLRSPEMDHRMVPGPSLMLPAIIVAVGLVGAALVWVAMSGRKPDAQEAGPVAAANPPSSPKAERAVALNPEEKVVTPPTPAPMIPVVTTPAAASAPPPSEPKPATFAGEPAAAPVKLAPKLNGIFYNPTRPTAIVNNKLVSIGSRVGESMVIAITQVSVTLAGGGQTNVLSLSE